MVAVTIAPGFTRFLRSPRDVVIGMVVSLGASFPCCYFCPRCWRLSYGNANLIAFWWLRGGVAPALLVIVLADLGPVMIRTCTSQRCHCHVVSTRERGS